MEGMTTGLALVVKKETAGELDTNIADIEKFVTERIQEYNPDLFDGDADRAKKARAELNKGKKQLADTRKEVIDRLMKPYQDFEERCKALERLIDTASGKLDAIVKIKESEEKEAKRKLVEAEWATRNFDLVPLEKVFNDKWLNKTYKMTDISKEMKVIIDRIYKELELLEREEDFETLKAHYLITLDLAETLAYGSELKEKRELAQKESEGRGERLHEERIAEQKRELAEDVKSHAQKSAMSSLVSQALEEEVEVSVEDYTITLSVTEAQLLAVRDYLNQQGIEHECRKLEF